MNAHETQLVGFLVGIEINFGLILNFGNRTVEEERKLERCDDRFTGL
jgi:hypothetical protein